MKSGLRTDYGCVILGVFKTPKEERIAMLIALLTTLVILISTPEEWVDNRIDDADREAMSTLLGYAPIEIGGSGTWVMPDEEAEAPSWSAGTWILDMPRPATSCPPNSSRCQRCSFCPPQSGPAGSWSHLASQARSVASPLSPDSYGRASRS